MRDRGRELTRSLEDIVLMGCWMGPLLLLSDPPGLHVLCFFLCGMEPQDPERIRKGTSEPLSARAFTNILVYFLFWEQVLMLCCVLWKLKSVSLINGFGLRHVLFHQCREAEIPKEAQQVRFTQCSEEWKSLPSNAALLSRLHRKMEIDE